MDTTKCNVFQYCKFLLYCGYCMVLVVLFMTGVSFYAVVFQFYGPLVFSSGIIGLIYGIIVIIFSSLVFMMLWSYLACVASSPGYVPQNWHPFVDDEEAQQMMERLPYLYQMFDRSDPLSPRYCRKCQHWKPPRTHHDSVSGNCVLKMDHYCIWVVNCVGLLNYKFFVLFLFYAQISCTFGCLLLLYPMVQFFRTGGEDGPAGIALFAWVLDLAFSLSLAGFLIMHYQLLSQNRSTIEAYEKSNSSWPFDKGYKKNFEEIFGRETWRCFVPMYTEDERRALLDSVLEQKLRAGIPSSDGQV
eukprot:TRINITY_DN24388_c0_g2_i1.p1 TRINITY_DN24388_c0_g2~~TRINITY_DN24388_c0_g2_i1.p1  ORF type:complete len:348 (-),score=6.49 TRINITY_DN24388_c0_g2_i1:327-1229(-)